MTASYGRPQPRRVQGFFEPTKASPMKPMDRQVVPQQQLGRIQDFTNPQIEAANAQRGYTEIANFMEGALGVAKPIYEEWRNSQIKGELEQIAGDKDFFSRYRSGDEQTQAYVRSLRPQTREIVEGYAAEAAVSEFNNSLAIEFANDNVLTGDSTVPERAARGAEIIGRNQEKYLDVIPASALVPQLGNIELGKAGARSKAQEIRVKEQDIQAQTTIRVGLSKVLLQELDFQTAVDTANSVLTEEEQQQQSESYRQLRKDNWTKRLDLLAENFNPTDVGKNYALAVAQTAAQLQADGRIDDAIAVVAEAREIASSYTFDNGATLGATSVGKNGATLSTSLSDMLIKLEKNADKIDVDRFIKDNDKNIKLAIFGETEAEKQLGLQRLYINGQGYTEGYIASLRQISDAQRLQGSIAQPPLTPEQQQDKFNLQLTIKDPQLTYDQRAEALRLSNLPIGTKLELIGSLSRDQPQGATALALTTTRNLGTEIEEAVIRLEMDRNAAVLSGLSAGTAPNKDGLTTELEGEVIRNTTEAIKQLELETGKRVLIEDAIAIGREQLALAEAGIRRKYQFFDGTSSQTVQQQAEERAYKRLNYVSNQIKAGVDRKSIDIFPPDFIDSLPPNRRTYDAALREFKDQFVGIRDENGKSLFPNFSQIWQDTTQKALDWQEQKPRPGAMGSTYQSGKTEEKGDEQASIGQQLEGALGALLNVVIPAAPANAESLDGKTDSDYTGMQTAEMLSAAMRRPGSVDLGPSTPGLPQQGAAAVTARPVPTQINSPNHPYFLAIGLNEGTRTADGGYTRAYYGHIDPALAGVGKGRLNRGTVSGFEGSPQQVDRQWASILSGRAIEARAFLRKAGLVDNTVGFQRVMFNVLDLMAQVGQYSGANDDFLGKLPEMAAAGFTIESVAKARTDSYINPSTGRLEAAGFGNSYNRLFQDQRRRAGTFDYKKRL